jgi:hypothetical protein
VPLDGISPTSDLSFTVITFTFLEIPRLIFFAFHSAGYNPHSLTVPCFPILFVLPLCRVGRIGFWPHVTQMKLLSLFDSGTRLCSSCLLFMPTSGTIYAGLRHCVPRLPGLSLFGRSLILVISEITANVVLWVLAGLIFGLRNESRGILSLCLLAWVIIFLP